MTVTKTLLLSASLIACASAVAIPSHHRRVHSDVAGHIIGSEGIEPSTGKANVPVAPSAPKEPILDLSKIEKKPQVPKPASYEAGVANQKSGSAPSTTTTTTSPAAESTSSGEAVTTTTTDPAQTSTTSDVTETTTTTDPAATTTSEEPAPTETDDIPPPAGGAGANGAATRGLLVQLTVPDDFTIAGAGADGAAGTFPEALVAAVPAIEQEAGTLSWFGAQITAEGGAATNSFVIFDTFADDAGRAAHLGGSVATSVVAQSPNFVGGLSIDAFDIISIKNTGAASQASTVTVGLQAQFEAQADKVADVQQFCTDSLALAEAEAGTINWLCGQWPGTNKFLILDSFVDQAGRDAHLNGDIAKNLFALADDTLVADPSIAQFNLVAASVKAGAAIDDANPGAGGGAAVTVPEPVAATNSITDTAAFGLLVPFTSKPDTAAAVQAFVQGATGLAAAEPGTLQWFGAAAQNATASDFLVFDTFATAAARDAHLAGEVASGLFGQIAALSSVDVIPFDVLAIKSLNDDAAVASETSGVTLGLRVLFNATSVESVTQVQQLCQAGLEAIKAEQGTVNWLCGQVPGTQTFVILDSFATEADRTTHLNGEFATSLLATVGVLINEPDIQQLEIFAGTSKADEGAAGGDGEEQTAPPAETTTTDSGEVPTTTSSVASESSSTTGSVETTTSSLTPIATPTGSSSEEPLKLVKVFRSIFT